METSKLDQLKIEREPETESSPTRWPWFVVAIALVMVASWWFLKPDAAIEVRTAVAREISRQAANTVLNASGYVTARRQATVSSKFTGKVMEVLIEEGMEVNFLVFPTPTHHTYDLSEIKNSWEVQAHFGRIFPEADHCRHCSGCTTSCPKGIDVEKGVELANRGQFREAGELFVECVMCNFCMTACPEFIAPNHVGIFARRVTAYFHIRPSNLINRLERLRKGELQILE